MIPFRTKDDLQKMVHAWRKVGKSVNEIADLLSITPEQVHEILLTVWSN